MESYYMRAIIVTVALWGWKMLLSRILGGEVAHGGEES